MSLPAIYRKNPGPAVRGTLHPISGLNSPHSALCLDFKNNRDVRDQLKIKHTTFLLTSVIYFPKEDLYVRLVGHGEGRLRRRVWYLPHG